MINICIWMNIPSHHQSQFFDALNKECFNFKVYYYEKVPSDRIEMGWESNVNLKSYESYIDSDNYQINLLDLKDYIHILPGYSHPLLLRLRNEFSKNDISWVHWSEKSFRTGIFWYLSFFKKIMHARYINNYALGALAIGNHAYNDFLRWGVLKEKIEILPYSFNFMKYSEKDEWIMNFKNDRFAFLFLGMLCKRKGVDLLLKAFAKKFRGNSKWCLVLVGNKKQDLDCEVLVKKLGITDQVLFRGVVSANEIMCAYTSCDVFILPSRHDGWGMGVNEAVYCNLPVIVSDTVAASEHLVQSGKNGFVFKSNDVISLAEQMEKYQDTQLIYEHKKHNSEIFSKYSSDSLSKHLVDILKSWTSKK